ncbi:MAG: hypothetical protein AMXMBFR7_23020 [Planctomycetota bacterium]
MGSVELAIPIDVPWRVDFSGQSLKACLSPDGSATLEFVAYYGPTDLNEDPGELKGRPQYPVRIVVIELKYVLHFEWKHKFDEGSSRRDEVDLSRIPFRLKDFKSVSEYEKAWSALGKCPDPMVYRIQNSNLLNSLVAKGVIESGYFIHLLVVSRNATVDGVCNEWEWRKA